jgi:hypothetical protein
MIIYIAFCNDRHTDPEIVAFRKSEDAIKYAKNFIDENKSDGAIVEEGCEQCYLYSADYSCEGDYVYAFASELQ